MDKERVDIHVNGSYRCTISKAEDLRTYLSPGEKSLLIDKILIIKRMITYINQLIKTKYLIKESRLDYIETLCIDLISNGECLVVIDLYI